MRRSEAPKEGRHEACEPAWGFLLCLLARCDGAPASWSAVGEG